MLYDELRNIINEWDPMNLICIGCPIDEYNGEIKSIYDAMQKGSDVYSLTNEIRNIFLVSFNNIDCISFSECYEIAIKCMDLFSK